MPVLFGVFVSKSSNSRTICPGFNSEGAIFDASESKIACERYFFNCIIGFPAAFSFLSFLGTSSGESGESGQSKFSTLKDY